MGFLARGAWRSRGRRRIVGIGRCRKLGIEGDVARDIFVLRAGKVFLFGFKENDIPRIRGFFFFFFSAALFLFLGDMCSVSSILGRIYGLRVHVQCDVVSISEGTLSTYLSRWT